MRSSASPRSVNTRARGASPASVDRAPSHVSICHTYPRGTEAAATSRVHSTYPPEDAGPERCLGRTRWAAAHTRSAHIVAHQASRLSRRIMPMVRAPVGVLCVEVCPCVGLRSTSNINRRNAPVDFPRLRARPLEPSLENGILLKLRSDASVRAAWLPRTESMENRTE